jgi:hypothetical protein
MMAHVNSRQLLMPLLVSRILPFGSLCLTSEALGNLTDFGYKCRYCNTINWITLEDGERKKHEYADSFRSDNPWYLVGYVVDDVDLFNDSEKIRVWELVSLSWAWWAYYA